MAGWFIGLMSGTSVDGVDGALLQFSTRRAPRTRALASRRMPASLRRELLELQRTQPGELDRAALAAIALSDQYARVVAELLKAASLPATRVTAIGAHGQTVRHRPELGYTVQLLSPSRLAERTGIDVVADLRSADVAAGGQGAPLVPAFHATVFGARRRRAIVNIGGIANVSLIAGRQVIGYDTGPGNVLMDAWHERRRGQRFDRGGRWAAGGQVVPALLQAMRSERYFALRPPKSTGRDLFDLDWLLRQVAQAAPRAEPRDVQATLLELTAASIADACRSFGAVEVFVCGGGARNGALMRRLGALMAPATVGDTGVLGIDPQAVEASAFAWLAHRRIEGSAGNLPSVTGAIGPRILGAVYPGSPARRRDPGLSR